MKSVLKASLMSLCLSVVLMTPLAQQDPIIDLPGVLAYIDTTYNVQSRNLTTDAVNQLTDDGDERTRRYQWPTWSQGNELAYFCCEQQPTTQVFLSNDGETPGDVVYEGVAEIFTYAYWSPQRCAETADCRDLTVLMSRISDQRFSLRRIRTGLEAPQTTLVDVGAPYYHSWSPDGTRILGYLNDSRLQVYDTVTDNMSNVPQNPGTFQAPAWSPVDDRLLLTVETEDNAESADLVIVANDDTQVLVPNLNGLVNFNWSPNGNYVAYTTIFQSRTNFLFVIDAITGEIVAQTNIDEVFAFFWSPNSEHIAYITSAAPAGSFSAKRTVPTQQTAGIAWGVLDISTNETRRYGNFIPTPEMVYMFNFFNQFAQSHSIWSPDSTHIVFAEQITEQSSIVNILNVTRRDSSPLTIDEGVIGVWSYD